MNHALLPLCWTGLRTLEALRLNGTEGEPPYAPASQRCDSLHPPKKGRLVSAPTSGILKSLGTQKKYVCIYIHTYSRKKCAYIYNYKGILLF